MQMPTQPRGTPLLRNGAIPAIGRTGRLVESPFHCVETALPGRPNGRHERPGWCRPTDTRCARLKRLSHKMLTNDMEINTIERLKSAAMILAVHNPKGGVGKTTTAVNVAAVLAGMGRKVLLIDLEAYAGSSISLGVRFKDLRPSIADVLMDRVRPADAVRSLPRFPNLHLITGSMALAQRLTMSSGARSRLH